MQRHQRFCLNRDPFVYTQFVFTEIVQHFYKQMRWIDSSLSSSSSNAVWICFALRPSVFGLLQLKEFVHKIAIAPMVMRMGTTDVV
mmetsp:Transcript_3395/g.8418  ORF Transcript_3395/g.8418 Transcript_3395/m.8418 type:complete len:86 (+) Transcript_3395:980-1237(+)